MRQANAIYLQKLLTDAGYDRHTIEGDWIIAASSYYHHSVTLLIDEIPILALPQEIAIQLNLHEAGNFIPLESTPDGFPMGMALKIDTLLHWLKKSIKLPTEKPMGITTTDVESLRKERRGQEKLRKALDDYWQNQCAVTEVKNRDFLVASHIKPWAECDSDEERLDIYNALLLNTALDRAFDQGYISFDEEGAIILSPHWNWDEAGSMGIHKAMRLRHFTRKHAEYLIYHQEHVFKR